MFRFSRQPGQPLRMINKYDQTYFIRTLYLKQADMQNLTEFYYYNILSFSNNIGESFYLLKKKNQSVKYKIMIKSGNIITIQVKKDYYCQIQYINIKLSQSCKFFNTPKQLYQQLFRGNILQQNKQQIRFFQQKNLLREIFFTNTKIQQFLLFHHVIFCTKNYTLIFILIIFQQTRETEILKINYIINNAMIGSKNIKFQKYVNILVNESSRRFTNFLSIL
ncbi:hypothetical protein pb186bvf_014706 [Paramecium bursaria]